MLAKYFDWMIDGGVWRFVLGLVIPAVAGTLLLVWPATMLGRSIDEDLAAMEVQVDAETGCHYLSRWGALTPRMDRAGKQICEEVRDGD